MPISFNIGGVRATIVNMTTLAVTEQQAANHSVAAGGAVLLTAIRSNVASRDHSLRDLARLDHPYARRHGSIQVHTTGGGPMLRTPSALVHAQSGKSIRRLFLEGMTEWLRITLGDEEAVAV